MATEIGDWANNVLINGMVGMVASYPLAAKTKNDNRFNAQCYES